MAGPQHTLLGPAGARECLLGNEAIVRGAIEAGVGFAAGYPGTPSSEITDSFAGLAGPDGIVFEYAVNEKIALEVAFAASLAGVRAICSMKHLGLMYAGDPLSTIPYVGVRGGLVIVSAGDPSCRTSPNEQDQRWLGPMLGIPVLDPSTPAQAQQMARFAFDLSEACRLPVLLRPTTRVCHTRQVIAYSERQPRRQARFQREPQRLVPIPGNARRLRRELDERLARAGELLADTPFLSASGNGELALLASGAPAALCADLVDELGLSDKLRLLEVGAVYPLAEQRLLELLAGVSRLLVVEELTPFWEERLQALCARRGLAIEILGKTSGHLPGPFEIQPGHIAAALHRAFGLGPAPQGVPEPQQLPARPPSLCPGCPHRASQFALRTVFGPEALYFNDIGCYTLGYGKPLQTADALLCMGAGFSLAAGVSATTGQRTVGIMGDSTFFHSGMPALLDAVKQRANLVAVILDNQVTAMTGFQESPEVHREGDRLRRRVSIAGVVKALGVEQVEVADPYDLAAAVTVLERARQQQGVSVVVFERPCPVFLARELHRPYRQAIYQVDPHACRRCGQAELGLACGRSPDEVFEQRLVLGRVRRGQAATGQAPCSQACPLGLCVQGYVADIIAGREREALERMLDQLVLPRTVCRVCDRPCEQACVLAGAGEPLAINDLKRYLVERVAAASEFPAGSGGPECGQRAAVVGAGPAGLAAARELRRRGWQVTLFDRDSQAGGLLRQGIPPYRLPRAALERDIAAILELGVEFRGNSELGRDVSLAGLLEEFAGVVLATGGGREAELRLPAHPRAPAQMAALDYLARSNSGGELPAAGEVLVVGGGNAAVDAARSARRRGARVTIVYRRLREEMPAFTEEIAAAEREGVQLRCQLVPLAWRPQGLLCQATRPGEPDVTGRRRPEPVPGSEELLSADLVLVATGQVGAADRLGLVGDIEAIAGGQLFIDPASGRTSNPRVFAAGDLVPGRRTVTWAIASGRRAAAALDATWRQGPAAELPPPPPEPLAQPRPRAPGVAPRPRQRPARHEPEVAAGDFAEIASAFTSEQALEEAARCLQCGSCGACRSCIDLFGCPAFVSDGRSITIDPELCMGCGVCAQLCPNGAVVKVADTSEPLLAPGPPEGSAGERP